MSNYVARLQNEPLCNLSTWSEMLKKPSVFQSPGVASMDFLSVKNKTGEMECSASAKRHAWQISSRACSVMFRTKGECSTADAASLHCCWSQHVAWCAQCKQPPFFFRVARDHSLNDAVACVVYTSGGQPTHMPRCRSKLRRSCPQVLL